jgi:hypothetical protein
LLSHLKNDDAVGPIVRTAICSALERIGPNAEIAVPALIDRAKRDPWPNVNARAAAALGRIGASASGSIPTLVVLVQRKEDDLIKCEAITALGRIGPAAAQAVPALIDAARSGDHAMRLSAIVALGQIGPAAAAALPALMDMLNDNQRFEPNAIAAILRIDPRSRGAVRQVLVKRREAIFQSHLDDDTVLMVAAVLGEDAPVVSASTRRILGDLPEWLEPEARDDHGWWLEGVHERLDSLGHLGPAGAGAIPGLRSLRDRASPLVQRWIAETIDLLSH